MKILANLAIAIYYCYQNGNVTALKLNFGQKVCFGNTILQENSNLFELLNQLKAIYKVFGIKEKIPNFDS